MDSHLTAYITLICTSGVLNLYLCLSVFLKRHHYASIASYFIVYTSTITIYCFASAFGLLATTLEQLKLWTVLIYVGMPVSAPWGLLFIMKYLGIKITKQRLIALLSIPIISFMMVVTNDFHHLHYRVFEVDSRLGAPYVHQEIGIWYVVHGIFTFSCMFIAFFLVVSHWRETAKEYRPQLLSLMWGQLVPMVTAFLYLIGLTPPGFDPVPMVLWLSSLLYLWAINSSRLFAIMPIAKDTIFNSINDGVMVLDESLRLIEYNQASKRMFPALRKSMFGMNFNDVWQVLSGCPFPFQLETDQVGKEMDIVNDESQHVYQVRTSPLQQGQNSKGSLIIFTDITELKRLQVKLERQAFYDELTQIFNRRAFFQKCEQAFVAAQKASFSFTAILMDIDFFKKVNDTYGHHIGDELLKHVVQECQTQLTDDILFARYGGEEFVLALNGQTEAEGEALANQLRQAVAAHPLMTDYGWISVTISCGVAELEKGSEDTLSQLLHKADKALYAAKGAGRNQVQVYKEVLKVTS
ncbi:histidine kinase N-terminal 7TM domain-containing diguanylate cyclase [Bacillus rubiinfantis]|uniref:histidine kinase N-terminal 7TM domain-containing diguanylate cyclase n=1 Tax=Bacillus rubiinfantis TaxID=1499680 RepID=UPI0005A7139A|nr:histidine kinase N-terminal 7TM domain-containing protein [Bacillus rubiinfantis]